MFFQWQKSCVPAISTYFNHGMGGFFISSHLKMGWWPWRIPSRHQRSQLLYHMAAGNIYGGQCGYDGNLTKIWDLSKRSDTMGYTFIKRMFIQLYISCLFERVLNFCLLPKNDLIGQTRVSSDIFMPNPFCSCENARQNGENTGPMRECQTTWADNFSLGNGIHFEERRFLSARMSKFLVFF